MSESATLEEPRVARPRDEKGRLMPKPVPKEPVCPINTELVQAHMDSVSKDVFLPTVKPGQTPMETYEDVDKDGKRIMRQRPRLSCELDAHGNVVPFSGPVFTDRAAEDLWSMLKPHIEHFANFSRRQMSEDLLVPNKDGEVEISEQSRVIRIPSGRFVFVPEGKQPV